MFIVPLAISAATLSLFTDYAVAQGTTNATCTANTWTTNQHTQSPCLVAAGLEAPCEGSSFNIPALQPGERYSGPLQGDSNKCICSTIVYSLVSACSICQGHEIASWDNWRTNCTDSDVSIARWPLSIPTGVAIPTWAYLNVTATGGIFDAAAASQLALKQQPDCTSQSPIGCGSSSEGNSKKSNHTGAIAGGVVGGVVGLALVLLGAFLLYNRKKARAASDKFLPGGEKYDITGGGVDRASPTLIPRAGSATPALPMQSAPPKLYDPADPSTFPASPAPTYPTYPSRSPFEGSGASDSMYTSAGYSSPQPLLSVHSHHTSPSLQSGKYVGVPEI